MTQHSDNPYPVDSTYHACCHAIGGHAPTCSATEPDLPVPPGATTDGWTSVDPDGTLVRSLEWSRYDTDSIGVSIDGWQDAKGAVARGITIYGAEGRSLTAGQAIQLAARLTAAASELMQLDRIGPLPSNVDAEARHG